MKPVDCFRKATKALVVEKPKADRQGYKLRIAAYADITTSYLNDLVMGRRVGKDETKRKIAKFFGYDDYFDFLALGEELLNNVTLEEAKAKIKKKQLLHLEQDGSIEKMLSFWPMTSENEKKMVRQYHRMLIFSNSKAGKKLENFKKNSRERFQYLWDSVLEKKAPQATPGWEGVDLLINYLAGKVTDVEVIEYADELNSVVPKDI